MLAYFLNNNSADIFHLYFDLYLHYKHLCRLYQGLYCIEKSQCVYFFSPETRAHHLTLCVWYVVSGWCVCMWCLYGVCGMWCLCGVCGVCMVCVVCGVCMVCVVCGVCVVCVYVVFVWCVWYVVCVWCVCMWCPLVGCDALISSPNMTKEYFFSIKSVHGVLRKSKGCLKGVYRKFQGSFEGVYRKFQGSFNEVWRLFQ